MQPLIGSYMTPEALSDGDQGAARFQGLAALARAAEDIALLVDKGALEWASSLALQAVKASKCLQGEQQQQTEALFGVVQAAYLTALQLMRHGLPAQQLLHALGIKQTLSPQVLTHRRSVQEQQTTIAGRPMNRVAMLHNVIPGALLLCLQKGFDPAASYWRQHAYFDPDTRFFSYFLPTLGGPAGSALQQAAQVVYDKLKGLWPRKMEAVVAAELWAHCRQPSSPHQLHFDTDETRLGASGVQADSLIHPVVSTVLFLDCCGCCGPTLVLDQTAVEATGGRAWVAHPFKGALLAYPGNLLHGVLPGNSGVCEQHCMRTTLVVVFWGPDMVLSRERLGLQPAMLLPTATDQAGEALGFLQDFPICNLEAEGDVALVTSVPEVQPAWVQVDADRTPDAESVLHQLPLPDLRFLLRDADTIVQLYATRQ